jgi:hypothetical protein
MDDENKEKVKKIGCIFFEKPLELSELSDWLSECEKNIDL